ncbi:hypothetical protein NMY22_g2402 [Coprinellus aureogranulatus]|nr:hypothetical protein NMY22_g2402 [Coprinellus aureogranulatus]
MPTTRRQAAIQEGKVKEEKPRPATRKRAGSKAGATQKRKRTDSTAKSSPKSKKGATTGGKDDGGKESKPRSKRARVTQDDIEHKSSTGKRPSAGNRRASSVPHAKEADEGRNNVYKTGGLSDPGMVTYLTATHRDD